MIFNNSLQTKAKFFLLLTSVAISTGCNKASFDKVDDEIKAKTISQQHVFPIPEGGRSPASLPATGGALPGDSGESPKSGSTVTPVPATGGTLPGNSGEPPKPGSTATPVPGSGTTPTAGTTPPAPTDRPATTPAVTDIPLSPTQIPLHFVCSNAESSSKHMNLIKSSSLKVEVVQYSGTPTETSASAVENSVLGSADSVPAGLTEVSRCVEDDPAILSQLKAGSKTLSFSKCAPKGGILTNGTPAMSQKSETQYFTLNFIADGGVTLISSRVRSTDAEVHILFDINGLGAGKITGFSTNATNQALCDSKASPLFVDMRSEYEKTQEFSLTPPWAGVLFDILGKNADPVAHTPNRISWFKSSSMAYIALPDKRGQVLGIDQLFGDNTTGPDGEFSSNGYEALAKYDLNGDQVINSDDAVYAKLKIWQDRNLDGKAAASELKSLADVQITIIDLRYDSKFSETDEYGNTIKYKSVAKMANGEYRLVFDIWFELNLYKASQNFVELARR